MSGVILHTMAARRLRGLIMLTAAACITAAAPLDAAQPGSRLTVVATNLNNPRKLFLAGDALYVVEAGTGGTDKCFGVGPTAVCVGRSGSVTRIANGHQRRTVTGLVSWARRSQQQALGPAAVLVRGEMYDILLDDDTVKPNGHNALGPDGRFAGDLVETRPGYPNTSVVADFAAFEATHNPDSGRGPGPTLGNPPIDSDPYAVVPYRGGYAVADAGANDLLWVSPTGKISVLAVFPTQTVKISPATAKRLGAPATMKSISLQSVPSCVTVGPDGALYVGELTARPFPPRKARIWRVEWRRKPHLYASGFTNISDMAFDGNDLFVLELADRGLFDQKSSGALIRLTPGGTRTILARTGLIAPTGLAIGRHVIYISNFGIFPGGGHGPHGEVVSVRLP